MTEIHDVQPDEGTIYFELTRSRTVPGFFYAAFVDHQEEPIVLASGHDDDLGNVFTIIKNVTERTL